jgi:hypothetical protein
MIFISAPLIQVRPPGALHALNDAFRVSIPTSHARYLPGFNSETAVRRAVVLEAKRPSRGRSGSGRLL